jgi:hypothetical protein
MHFDYCPVPTITRAPNPNTPTAASRTLSMAHHDAQIGNDLKPRVNRAAVLHVAKGVKAETFTLFESSNSVGSPSMPNLRKWRYIMRGVNRMSERGGPSVALFENIAVCLRRRVTQQ